MKTHNDVSRLLLMAFPSDGIIHIELQQHRTSEPYNRSSFVPTDTNMFCSLFDLTNRWSVVAKGSEGTFLRTGTREFYLSDLRNDWH